MAIEVLDYMATLGDGIARATPESVLESRMGGGCGSGGAPGFGGPAATGALKKRDVRAGAGLGFDKIGAFKPAAGSSLRRGGMAGAAPPPGSQSTPGFPGRVTTDCSGCDTGGADAFCGNDGTNSKYAYSVGEWTPMFQGGCRREIGCVDYAGSCGSFDPMPMGDECDAEYIDCSPTSGDFVFIPNVSEGIATGGQCYVAWTCTGGLEPDTYTCGVTRPRPSNYSPLSVAANVSAPQTQYCDGVETSVDDSWRNPQAPGHGVDDETIPSGIGTGFWAALNAAAPQAGATDNTWGVGQGCVINNYSDFVKVYSAEGGCQRIAPGTSSDCRFGGQDLDFILSPITRDKWYAIDTAMTGFFSTATVNPDGSISGDVALIVRANPHQRAWMATCT